MPTESCGPTNNNNNNKGLTSVSSSKDGVRDVPAAYITTNRFTQNDLKRYKTEEKNEIKNGAGPVIRRQSGEK